jgi:chemotaxis protein MotA
MQPGPIIGIVVALFAILFGNVLEGGHLGSIVGGPAALIVIGGTIGAVMVQYPMSTLLESLRAAGRTFKKPSQDGHKLIDEIVDYANRARKDGILALEKVASGASDPFLAKALMMAIDGADSTTLRETMEIAIGQKEEHGEDAAKAFEAAGGYCPTVGIIGAVLGLIHVMSNLSDISAVGAGIAGAFVATIYGVAAANIIFLPLGGRIKLRLREEITLKELTLVGVLAIQEGMNPKLVRERLAEFVHAPSSKAGAQAGEAARAAAAPSS